MPGSAAGAEKTAAIRLGLTLEEYKRRIAAGQKFCGACKEWHRRREFGLDKTRGDGYAATCLASRRAKR